VLRSFGTAIITAALCFGIAAATGWGRSAEPGGHHRAGRDIVAHFGDFFSLPAIRWACNYASTGNAPGVSLDCLPTTKTVGFPRITIYRDRVIVEPFVAGTKPVTFKVHRK